MQIPGTAAPGAYSQPSREVSFRSGGKRRCLFMSDVNPLNLFSFANRVGNAIERVAGNTINPPNPCFCENIHQQVRYFFLGHDAILSEGIEEEFSFSRWCGFPLRHTTVKINTTQAFSLRRPLNLKSTGRIPLPATAEICA